MDNTTDGTFEGGGVGSGIRGDIGCCIIITLLVLFLTVITFVLLVVVEGRGEEGGSNRRSKGGRGEERSCRGAHNVT